MTEQYANRFATRLTAYVDTDDLTIAVAAAAPVSIQDGPFRVLVGDELLLVTSGQDTTTWTVTRGVEGTTAAVHAAQAKVTHVLTAEGFDARSEIAERRALHSPAAEQAPFAFDDFDRADGTLQGMVAPSGQAWATSGPGAATAAISGRRITSAANVYASLDYGSAVPRVSGTFSFEPGTGADNRATNVLCLIADAASIGLSTMLHVSFSPTKFTLSKYVSGTPTIIAVGFYDVINGVPYNMALEIDGTTATVYPPQGVPVSVTDADIGTAIIPRYGIWQILPGADALTGTWWRVDMGPAQQGRTAAASGAAPAAEVEWLRGTRLTRRQRIVFAPAVEGWYRIATTDTETGFPAILGHVSLDARGPYSWTGWEVDVVAFYNATPTLAKTYSASTVAWNTSVLRASRDGAGVVALDVYMGNSFGMTVQAELTGYFTVVSAPVIGAVALATESVTLNAS